MNAENAIITKLWSEDLQRFVSSYIDRNGTQTVPIHFVKLFLQAILKSWITRLYSLFSHFFWSPSLIVS